MRTPPKGFELYLVKDKTKNKLGINKLMLEDKPLISNDNIIAYNWKLHILKLYNNFDKHEYVHRKFVVMVDGERLYSGAFTSVFTGVAPVETNIFASFDYCNYDKYVFLALGRCQPYEDIPLDNMSVFTDSRIKETLERDKKLILHTPYEPTHFEKPNSIHMRIQGNSMFLNMYHWEKVDKTLRILDSRFTENIAEMNFKPTSQAIESDICIEIGAYHDKDSKAHWLGFPLIGDYKDLLIIDGDTESRVAKLNSINIDTVNILVNDLFAYEHLFFINDISKEHFANSDLEFNSKALKEKWTYDDVMKYLDNDVRVLNPPFELTLTNYNKEYQIIKDEEGQIVYDRFSFLFSNDKINKAFTLELSKTSNFNISTMVYLNYFGTKLYLGCYNDSSKNSMVYVAYYTYGSLNHKIVSSTLSKDEFREVVRFFMRFTRSLLI